MAQWAKNPTSIHEDSGVGRRHSSDLVLLWLWHRPAAAAPIQPLAWELAYATVMALKKNEKEKEKKEKKKVIHIIQF